VDIIWDLDWDCMHGVFLNVTGRMLRLLFNKEHEEAPFSCYKLLDRANTLIDKFKIPHSNSRPLHKLEKFEDWKQQNFGTISFMIF
jgi:hypothetical protein